MHKDLKHLWLPYTQMKNIGSPLKAVNTKGCDIFLKDGKVLLDSISSWWTSCLGYNNSYLIKAVTKQLNAMPHVMFGGIIHDQAVNLSKKITSLIKNDLEKVFFVDSGSVSVEVALKMAVQFWINQGKKEKNKFVHFKNGYHGDTSGAMSVCDPSEGMHFIFGKYLNKNLFCELPTTLLLKKKLENTIKKNKDKIAGIIVEPLVQCAGGMKIYPPKILNIIYELKKKYNILLILDEIATGFGRTGTMFAFHQSKAKPDIVCIGKALTGGMVSLSATVTTKKIFNAFLGSRKNIEFMHGPTYMANPLACSAANATINYLEKNKLLIKVKNIEKYFNLNLRKFNKYSFVNKTRYLGAIGVIELNTLDNKNLIWLRNEFIKRGVWVRPLRNVVYFMPPYIIKKHQLEKIFKTTLDIFELWQKQIVKKII
ncbi:MAG: Adenosylmethionine-8-amino-7-oxononanoate aminotransferase [Alphaproteobacteria bacterium MarineAlpha9_Bin4]|nr:adenosylmethionine--8-amino-7-oxononanoate transaminase [Pelagibacterales bacterium]PPR25151.1 MAG: Adenosylmethionine-8-amino-7-oxononanoate aminotransferase [Alphaproteobacteria bacterium MarineAlpha9_Bin4]|tara:strand:+ start:3382 stop:4659 length:1278 start_codon:yes stop_codon:yes gene_type:complete